MILWLILGPYVAAGLLAARMVAGALAWDWALRNDGRPDNFQWCGAALLGLAAGCIWPLMLALWKLPFPAVGAEREQRLRERARRIRALEREAGIR